MRATPSLAVVLVLLSFNAFSQSTANRFIYVNNNSSPNEISGYSVDNNGFLTPIGAFETGGFGGGTCGNIGSITTVRSGGDFLYATNMNSHDVSGFQIDADGSLEPVPGSPFKTSGLVPTGVVASVDGKYLFVGLQQEFRIDVFAINSDGSLTLESTSAPQPLAAGFDVIYAETIKKVMTDSNQSDVSVFDVTPDGDLVLIGQFPTGTTNTHKLALRPPADDCLYVAGGNNESASFMDVQSDGTLTPLGIVTMPGELAIVSSAVTPQGTFVYFGAYPNSNRIYGFSTDTTCTLTPLPGNPFQSGGVAPAGLTTDNDGKFLFALNTKSLSVSSLQITQNGALLLVDTKPLQGSPGALATACPYGIVFTLAGAGDEQVPATLVLDPPIATNPVNTKHCVTAIVLDESGQPVPGVTVQFTVTGSVMTSGSATTDQNGQATFCYTGPLLPGSDVIRAFADTDNDGTEDPGEPFGVAKKVWIFPPTTPGCEINITQGGRITANNGDKATFGGNAKADAQGNTQGQQEYQDHGPADPMNVHSINVLSIVCVGSTYAEIYGQATVDGAGSYDYRIQVRDNEEPGVGKDTYWIALSNGYSSGDKVLEGGNVQIRRESTTASLKSFYRTVSGRLARVVGWIADRMPFRRRAG